MKKLTRAKAIEQGLSRYFEGKTCSHGHVSERYVLNYSCVECHLTVYSDNYWKDRDRCQYQREYYREIAKACPERIMLQSAKVRAKRYKVPCSITAEDIRKIWPKSNKCPALGIKLKKNTSGTGGNHDVSPSLDRIVPKLGYVVGNIAIISMRANRIKGSESDPQILIKVANWLKKVKSKKKG